MPKAPRAPVSATARQARKHNPLSEEYAPTDASFKQKAPKSKRKGDDDTAETSYVDSAASKKILKIGKDLVDEEAAEESALRRELGIDDDEPENESLAKLLAEKQRLQMEQQREQDGEESWEDAEEFIVSDDEDGNAYDPNQEIEPVDLEAFNKFNSSFDDPLLHGGQPVPSREPGTRNLADIILAKIAEQEAGQAGGADGMADADGDDAEPEISPRVVQVYTAIGAVMSRQNTGKLPKPFTMIATLPLGMQGQLIAMTEPDRWTPYVAYSATKLFISKPPSVALQFLNHAILPMIQDKIADHPQHKLHPTLYRTLKKALYKPAAFFKGIVFPMLESGCTMREAHIVASVIARVSIPVLHSAAALMRLTEIAASKSLTSWNTKGGTGGGAGPVNWFIKVLIEKKYALPFKVVDALVFHFLRFRGVIAAANAAAAAEEDGGDDAEMRDFNRPMGAHLTREDSLPLLWHQSLLAFAQRYRDDITEDQREALLDLLLGKGHRSIGPEIRRELLAGRGRGMPALAGEGMMVLNGGDDTMDGVQIAA